MVDGLELEGAGDALGIALLNVEGGGKPEVGLDVGAPAVEVVELLVILLLSGEVAVEADDVAVAGLDPDAAEEATGGALAGDGGDVEDGGGSVAEEVVADIAEGVVLLVEVVGVHEDHLDEAGFVEVEMEAAAKAGDVGHRVLEEAELAVVAGALRGGLVDLVGLVADDLVELDACEVVLVGLRDLAEDRIGLHVLNVGFDEGSPLLDGLDDLLFAHDGLVNKGALRGGELACRQDILWLLLLADER